MKKFADDLIVSVTSYPARIKTVHKTIESLLAQTLQPRKIILYLANNQFPHQTLPNNLTQLIRGGEYLKFIGSITILNRLKN